MHYDGMMQANIETIWTKVIRVLLDKGLTHVGIARRVGTQQSTISRLYAGHVAQPGFFLGASLIELAGGDRVLASHGIVLSDYVQVGGDDPSADSPPAAVNSEGSAPIDPTPAHPAAVEAAAPFQPGA